MKEIILYAAAFLNDHNFGYFILRWMEYYHKQNSIDDKYNGCYWKITNYKIAELIA